MQFKSQLGERGLYAFRGQWGGLLLQSLNSIWFFYRYFKRYYALYFKTKSPELSSLGYIVLLVDYAKSSSLILYVMILKYCGQTSF